MGQERARCLRNYEGHGRRSIRLKGYDYSGKGAYFVTICTRNRECVLGSGPITKIIRGVWSELPDRFQNIQLDEFIIMPNHIHGIIKIVGAPLGAPHSNEDDREGKKILEEYLRGAASGTPTLSQVIRVFKSISAIGINRHLNRQWNPVWQRNYYERIIRNQAELDALRQYIRDNPLHWNQDQENPANWNSY